MATGGGERRMILCKENRMVCHFPAQNRVTIFDQIGFAGPSAIFWKQGIVVLGYRFKLLEVHAAPAEIGTFQVYITDVDIGEVCIYS